jgi:CDP-6-deoxy-D-xylo-4-hexulose-3-dehydrase
MDKISSFAIPVLCRNPEIKTKLLRLCKNLNIETRPMIAGSIAQQPFMSKCVWKSDKLDGADFIHNNYFYIGNHEAIGEKENQALGHLFS